MGSQIYWVSRLILTTQQPHSFAYLIGSKMLVGRSVLPKVVDRLQICRAGVGAPATLISAGKGMGTGDLCAKLVPPTLLFLAHNTYERQSHA
jgi:hypothetical protein